MTALQEHGASTRVSRSSRTGGRHWPWLLTIVASAATGVLIGWAAFGNGDTPESEPSRTYVTPEAEELTPRQTEMVAVMEQYMAAWKTTDGQQLETLMVDDGYVEYAEEGWRFDLEDGALQARVTNGPYDSIENYDPMLVYEDRIVLTGRVNSVEVAWLSVVRFTTTGDVKVIHETIYL